MAEAVKLSSTLNLFGIYICLLLIVIFGYYYLRPNGLALDSENKNIYWCDAKLDRIEKAGIDGSNRQVVTDDKLPHPFGFSHLDDLVS